MLFQRSRVNKFHKRKPGSQKTLQLPKSICVLTTHQKHLCSHTYLTTTEKNNRNPYCENAQKSDILRVRWGAICTLRSFSLLLVFRHCPKECENLASHPKRNYPLLDLRLDLLVHPQIGGETPLAEVPYCLPLDKTSKSSSFQQSPPPCPISYTTSGSKFMHFRQKTDVSAEGTRHVMVHLAARWPKF